MTFEPTTNMPKLPVFNPCPICGLLNQPFEHDPRWGKKFICTRCGVVAVAVNAENVVEQLSKHRKSNLSQLARRSQDGKNVFVVYLEELKTMDLDRPLPKPAEQADNLILWLGEHQSNVQDGLCPQAHELAAWIGLPINHQNPEGALSWLRQQDEVQRLTDIDVSLSHSTYRLTMAGWQYYELLKRAQVNSRFAFMAMEFGHDELDLVVENCFRPAVERTGFTLSAITHGQTAGNIDAQIQERITAARFMVADLTHRNPGAYWEAGLATGQGKPVFYTCRKAEFDNKVSHFDTNHHVTIIWTDDKLDEAGRELTAKIRNTLPIETIPFQPDELIT